MNIIESSFFKRAYRKITGISYNVSYSQTGEDLIIDFLIQAKKIKNFSYLDIGANHPIKMNNTYKFYLAGYKGTNIEPDPFLFSKLKAKRVKDLCLNVGITAESSGTSKFYLMDNPVLNTFSKQEAESLVNNKQATIKQIVDLPVININNLLEDYIKKTPSFINLDVEGIDEEILKAFPFNKHRPFVFCIETVGYTEDASSGKRSEIFELMNNAGYIPFADTYINTIFIDKNF